MKLLESIGNWLIWAGGMLKPGPHDQDIQQPLGQVGPPTHRVGGDPGYGSGPPIFSPPNGPPDYHLKCDYSAMGKEWRSCSTETNRGCWLTNGTFEYNINTDYENIAPVGKTRRYWLDVDKMTLSGDGYSMKYGKVFNQTYPGPWITACWGDKIQVTVTNRLQYNGTSIHWHGVRQLNNMEADGVNAISQCPIPGAPFNESYTYKFTAQQYGTTWYHSHYSMQYGDGLLGPLTFYGPSSASYDEAISPLLMTDNLHMSGFEAFYKEVVPGLGPPPMDGILLNGIGQYNCTKNETKSGICVTQNTRFNVTVSKGKKYLLRLINTSVDTTFAFSIDNHMLEVMSSDFVPIKPYNTTSVLVGIGQRYHVILHAVPVNKTQPDHQPRPYWIRTTPADGCYNFGKDAAGKRKVLNDTTGILYYEGCNNQTDIPETPISEQVSTACADEPYESLIPILPWAVDYPSNQQENSTFEVSLVPPMAPGPFPPRGNFSRWTLGMQPMWLDFGDPTINHVNENRKSWEDNLVIVPELGNYTSVPNKHKWIYLLITGDPFPFGNPKKNNFIPVAHPIHLHGHDFALVAQSPRPYWPGFAKLKTDNPPRRDVALLPQGGFLIIAFKADNPGAWIMHCHIAWHASAGLAVQILERDGSIKKNDPKEIDRVCKRWKEWHKNRSHWWHGSEADSEFQDDSGI